MALLITDLFLDFLLVPLQQPVTVHLVDRDRRIRIDTPFLSIFLCPSILNLEGDSLDPRVDNTLCIDIDLALFQCPPFNP